MEPPDALEAKIREKAQKLEQFAEHIMSCRVTIDLDHKHHQQGKLFSVKLDITVPGKEIVIDRHPDKHHAHEDVYVALRDTFDAARRQLEDYGLIETPDSREIYFHRNSVVEENFDNLNEGDKVRFSDEMGDKGPQASTVHVEGKHHIT